MPYFSNNSVTPIAVQGANDAAAYLYRAGCAGVCALFVNFRHRYRVGTGVSRVITTGAQIPDARFRRPEQDQAVFTRTAVVIAATGDAPSGGAVPVILV